MMRLLRPSLSRVARFQAMEAKSSVFLLFSLAGLLLAGREPLSAQERPQFAVVDYAVLFKDYYKSAEAKKRLDKKQEELKSDMEERMNTGNQLVQSAKKIYEDMQSPVISEAKKKELGTQLKEKQMEIESRQKIFEEFSKQSFGLLKKMQDQENEVILADISKAINLVAKNKYTVVFSKAQVDRNPGPAPGSVVFSEGPDEITAQVLALLNKDAPAAGAAKKEDKK